MDFIEHFFDIVKIIVSAGMVGFGVRVFHHAAQIKRLIPEKLGREKRLADAEAFARRGNTAILAEEQKKYRTILNEIDRHEGNYKLLNNLLAGCAIVLAAVEIILTISTFKK